MQPIIRLGSEITFSFRKFYVKAYEWRRYSCAISYTPYTPYSTAYSEIVAAKYDETELIIHTDMNITTSGWLSVNILHDFTWTVIFIAGTNLGMTEVFDHYDRTKATYMDFYFICESNEGDIVRIKAKHVKHA